MSAKTASKHSILSDDVASNSSAATCAEDSMLATENFNPTDTSTCDHDAADPSVAIVVVDQSAGSTMDPVTDAPSEDCGLSDGPANSDHDPEDRGRSNDASAPASYSDTREAQSDEATSETPDFAVSSATQQFAEESEQSVSDAGNGKTSERDPESGEAAQTKLPTMSVAPSLPDPSEISARLKNLVVSVTQVEELSKLAREAASNDLALYNGIAASQRQFDDGLAEARRIGQEAQAVYQRAFGKEARAVAEPAVAEARDVESAFAELADAWRTQAESFLAEHPDVETLLAEQQQQNDEARRREAARARVDRFQQLVTATDAALRQSLLDDARDCLKLLAREFPNEAARVAPLQERLDHRVRATNDTAARRILLQASELQGRGDFDASVRLLESVEVQGLSRETSEDVFGRWSAACSLLGQTGGLELVRYSPTQGRGVILHHDPSVPYGLVVFSSLGMGANYFEGRVVSNTDREGGAIVARARPFRAAEVSPEMNGGWYGRSYVTSSAAGAPVRH